MSTLTIDRHEIQLSNEEKVLFGDSGLTKGDLVDYYCKAADLILAHAGGRVLSMLRFPDGIEGGRFFQKRVPDYFPDWIETVEVQAEQDTLCQMVLQHPADLVYLANQACITLHTWLAPADQLDLPDRMIFDLDPPEAGFPAVRDAAQWLRELLEQIGLYTGVMTTGSKGLHVIVPIRREWPFDQVRHLAGDVARLLARRHGDALTVEQRKAKRNDRVFIDYLRNAYAQTAVAPYSVRARPGGPVATPLDWDELDNPDLDARTYTMDNLFQRMGQRKDPFADLARHARKLDAPRDALDKLLADEKD
ncbi:MAG: non-homologous end-joining DNA ligase [Planctomycetota bacterium]